MPFIVVNEASTHVSDLFSKDFQELDLKFEAPALLNEFEDHQNEAKSTFLVPGNKRLRPFFFMRQIELSMTSPEGAFLSETLFVPKYVWHQQRA